jgi:hypothetical protein
VMVYALRGLAVSLSMFVLAYAVLRVAVACGWSAGKRRSQWMSPGVLYALQVGPFVVAATIVAAFAIPSFLRFEPKSVEEAFGLPVLALSAVCVWWLVMGGFRAWQAYARTARTVRQWHPQAKAAREASGLIIYETGRDAPPLAVAGFWRPKLLVSPSATRVFTEEELARAIAHESAHIQRNDNLKKLLLRVASYPRTREIERLWLAALEIDADRQAVRNRREALELASALVKASRLTVANAELTTNLTSDSGALLQERVERLLAWEATQSSNRNTRYDGLAVVGAVAAVVIIAFYPSILSAIHSLAELLMQ